MPHNRKNYRRNKAIRKRKERELQAELDRDPNASFRNGSGEVDTTYYYAEQIINGRYNHDEAYSRNVAKRGGV